MEQISHYFDLSAKQTEQFECLKGLYEKWNAKINVISRKDMEAFYTHHVLHSLSIAKIQPFAKGSEILDVGTGGGFPGIPLAILFPEVDFTLVDSIGKKIKVVQGVVSSLELTNVKAIQVRAETIKHEYDFIISRAVTQMPEFVKWVKDKVKRKSVHELKNGIFCLKGGNLERELSPYETVQIFNINSFFADSFFETKKVVYLPIKRK